jgi:hypothetical protein
MEYWSDGVVGNASTTKQSGGFMIKRHDVSASTGILLVFFLLGFAYAQQPPKS